MTVKSKVTQFHEELLNTATDGIFELDYKGIVTYINESGAKKLGYKNSSEFLNDIKRDEKFPVFSFIENHFKTTKKPIKNYEFQIPGKKGKKIFLETSVYKINDKKGYTGIFKDISEKKKLKDSLEKSERKLESLTENLPDIIFTISPGGKITSINKTVHELLDIPPENIINKHYSKLISSKYSDTVKENLNKLKSKEHTVIRNIELSLFTRDKSRKEFDLNAKAIYDKDGNMIEAIGILRDITARKEIEREIENTKNFLRLIQENIEEGIMVLNNNFEVVLLNTYVLDLCGLEDNKENVIGKKCYEVLHGKSEHCQGCPSKKTFRNHDVNKLSMKLEKNNCTLNLELTTYPIKDVFGEVIQVIETIKNVTEKKLLENQISEYTLRLEKKIAELHMLNAIGNILQTTHSFYAVLQIILIGVTASQGLMFNRAFLLLIDEETEMLEGTIAIGPSDESEAYKIWGELSQRYQTLEEILMTYDNLLVKQNIRVNEIIKQIKIPLSNSNNILIKSINNKKSYNVKNHKTEEFEDYEISSYLGTDSFAISPLITKDKALGVVIVDNYINKQPIMEEDVNLLEIFCNHASFAIENTQLIKELGQKVEQLEELNKMLSEYQKKMTQTERLATIGEFANYIAHEIRNPLVAIGGFTRNMIKKRKKDDPDFQYLKIIQNEVQRLELLLTNIMDFTKTFEPRLQPENLNNIIDDTLLMFYGEISNEITVIKRYCENLPVIDLDSHQIKQVILNILRNSINAMPDGGIITIETKVSENVIQMSIADNGKGMPEDLLKDAFKPFFTTNPSGSGLGLAISKQIIANHKGNIKIESKENEGTTVYVQIPFNHRKS